MAVGVAGPVGPHPRIPPETAVRATCGPGQSLRLHNRADDEHDAQELEARRIVGPSGHHAGDAESDGEDGNDVLHAGVPSEASVPGPPWRFIPRPTRAGHRLAAEHPAHHPGC